MSDIEPDAVTDNTDPDADIDDTGPITPFAVPLVEPLLSTAYPAFERPAELFDALVEGHLSSFVRLPTSFDCCVQIPARYWRGVDPGDFGAAFGEPPYRPQDTFRVQSDVILQSVRHAVEHQLFSQWADTERDDDLLYAIGHDEGLGSYDQSTPPPLAILCSRLEQDLARTPAAFVKSKGYAVFVEHTMLDTYREKRLEQKAHRGRIVGINWAEVWACGVAYLLDEGTPAKVVAGEIIKRLKNAGVKDIPTEKTMQKELSKALSKYRLGPRSR